jgi:flagellar basal body P-ring formation protein FlgA
MNRWIWSLPLLLAATPAAAQAKFQDTAMLDMAVAQFTGQAIGLEGGARTAVDRRLKLAACSLPQVEWRSPAQDSVVVRCMSPVWRIYVPVMAEPKPVMQQAAAMTVAAAPVRAEPVIKRGDPVTIAAGSSGFSITRDGIAMGDAVQGARFMVRVDPAKPPIQAVAIEPGRATLPGWAN